MTQVPEEDPDNILKITIGYWLCTNSIEWSDIYLFRQEISWRPIPHEKQELCYALFAKVAELSQDWKPGIWERQSQWPNNPEHRIGAVSIVMNRIVCCFNLQEQEAIFSLLCGFSMSETMPKERFEWR